MADPISLATVSVAALAGLSILSLAVLKGWTGWLDLQRAGLGGVRRAAGEGRESGPPSSAARIELADLRERVRKLEAIAAGVDP